MARTLIILSILLLLPILSWGQGMIHIVKKKATQQTSTAWNAVVAYWTVTSMHGTQVQTWLCDDIESAVHEGRN
jgi:hypothetical protein